jgi:electron transfer flavoprotein alpha/beta subunit
LAERLGLPQISYAREIAVEDEQVVVDRELGDSAQTVKASLPVVISVTEETNTPRRPTLMDALKAKKKPVNLWQVDGELALSKDTLEQRIALEKVGTEGIVIHRKQELLKGGSSAELANQLIDLLLQENVITEGGA